MGTPAGQEADGNARLERKRTGGHPESHGAVGDGKVERKNSTCTGIASNLLSAESQVSEENFNVRIILFVINEPPKRPDTNRVFLWLFLATITGLNFWFDYYHPAGIILDIIILLALGFKYLSSENSN
jgi:hypothetical protein